jgi:hypothetical protein
MRRDVGVVFAAEEPPRRFSRQVTHTYVQLIDRPGHLARSGFAFPMTAVE